MLKRLLTNRKKQALHRVRAVLFDLDGTLLQVGMEDFIPTYISGLGRHLEDRVSVETFATVARLAVERLFTHATEERTNEEHFLETIEAGTGIPPELFQQRLRHYCGNGMAQLEPLIAVVPAGRTIVERCAALGYKVALATNPVFPAELIDARLRWGGLNDLPFAQITSYENTHFCKPDPRYYRQIAEALGVMPEECLMVGNDTRFDLGAADAGMLTYLVDTYLIDRGNVRSRPDFRGNHDELLTFIDNLASEQGIR